ncbi:MAG: hypothetical protein WC530_09945 [Candidatus Omnitrophota bacterium]
MAEVKTTTQKMPKETEQQYAAWLLYCEAGSLRKTLEAWDRLGQDWGEIGAVFASRLGKKPVETTIENWSKKFHWVERREIKLAEDLMALREKTKRIKRDKLHRIAEAFDRVGNKIMKRLRANEEPTILEWKIVWEMFQVELGKPTNRSQLKLEDEQRPLTPEEKEYGKKLHEAVKEIVRKQHGKKE